MSCTSTAKDAVGALAYTSGSSIVFKEGQYAPQKEEGQRLLAHELTHVAQQQSAVHGESLAGTVVVLTVGAAVAFRFVAQRPGLFTSPTEEKGPPPAESP